ncbi:MAG: hypothetical protein U5K56_15950 [Halioglobus sp.]|nr:hypothetical protein [Halioglobus sp.]
MRHITFLFAFLFVGPLTACGGDDNALSGGANEAAQASVGNAASSSGDSAKDGEVAAGADGTITATLEGERRTWYIVRKEMGGEMHSQSEWAGWTASGRVVTLYGHTSPDSLASTGGLMLELNLVVMENTSTVSSASVSYLRGGIEDMYVTRGPITDGVELDNYEEAGDRVTVSGNFEATLQQNTSGETTDPDTIELEDGTFSATVYKAPGR